MRIKRKSLILEQIIATLSVLILLGVLFLAVDAKADYDPTGVGTVVLTHTTAVAGTLRESDASAPEDTDGIMDWDDDSGNGFNATQATSGNRPTYSATGLNGYPCVMGASDQWLEIGNKTIFKNRSAMTLFWLARYETSGTAQGVIANFTGDGTFNIRTSLAVNSSDQPYTQLRNPDATNNDTFSNDALTDATVHAVAVVMDLGASTWELYIDKVSVHTGSLSGTSNTSNTDSDGTNAYLLATENGNTNTNRSCTGVIAMWSTALTSGQITTATDGFKADFGYGSATVYRNGTSLGVGR